MSGHRILTGALASLLLGGQAAAAQTDLTTLPLEDLMSLEVVSASRFMQKASEAPSSVTVITAEDIRAYGWRTLAEALRSIRGLYSSNDRSYSYVGARGFLRAGDYNSRFLLQIDGTRINDAVFDQALLGQEFPLDLELVDRIEFVPGPGSSIYGANAFFGVINVITKHARDLEGVRATIEGGQSGARRGAASYAWRDGASEMLFSASRYASDGRDLYVPEYKATAHGLDWESGERFYARGQHGPFTLTLLGGERRKGTPTATYGQPFDVPGGSLTDRFNLAELAYRSNVAEQGELTVRVYRGDYDYLGNYVNDDAIYSLNRDETRSRWWGADTSIYLPLSASHKLVAGAEYQYNYQLVQLNYDTDPYALLLDDQHRYRRYGLYAQDEITLAPGLLLNAGARFDRDSRSGGAFSPRLALIADIAHATTLKAMYGTAFRSPNSYELYYTVGGDGGQLGNPGLNRERIRTTEVVLVRELAGNARLTVTAFHNQLSDLIGQQEDPVSGLPQFQNADHFRAQGIEAEYERNYARGTRLRTSVAYQNVRQDEANSPSVLAKLNVVRLLHYHWHAGFEAQYTSRRDLMGGGHAGAFWLANLNLFTIGLTRHIDTSITLSNLFDRRYADPASSATLQRAIAQDGRRVLVRLRLSY